MSEPFLFGAPEEHGRLSRDPEGAIGIGADFRRGPSRRRRLPDQAVGAVMGSRRSRRTELNAQFHVLNFTGLGSHDGKKDGADRRDWDVPAT